MICLVFQKTGKWRSLRTSVAKRGLEEQAKRVGERRLHVAKKTFVMRWNSMESKQRHLDRMVLSVAILCLGYYSVWKR